MRKWGQQRYGNRMNNGRTTDAQRIYGDDGVTAPEGKGRGTTPDSPGLTFEWNHRMMGKVSVGYGVKHGRLGLKYTEQLQAEVGGFTVSCPHAIIDPSEACKDYQRNQTHVSPPGLPLKQELWGVFVRERWSSEFSEIWIISVLIGAIEMWTEAGSLAGVQVTQGGSFEVHSHPGYTIHKAFRLEETV